MKKLIALLLAMVMVFALVACAAEEPAPEAEEPATETEEPAEETEEPAEEETAEPVDVNAVVFWYNYSDAFLSTVRTALDAELEAAGITFSNQDAQGDQAKQNEQIDTAISQGANLLIVNIVETGAVDAAQNIVNKAKDADIPVIFFNREPAKEVINSYEKACFVGTNPAEAGVMQGELAGEYIVANFDAVDLNKDGKISYIMMKGQIGNPEAELRTSESVKYCNEALVAAGKEELAYYDPANTDMFQMTDWAKDKAFEQMTTALGTNALDGDAPIEVVFANNDDAALGCVQALNNVGYNTGDDKFIPVFGVDFTAEAEAAIAEGKMAGSILQSATGMAQTITAIVSNVAAGADIMANTDTLNVDADAAMIRVPYEKKSA